MYERDRQTQTHRHRMTAKAVLAPRGKLAIEDDKVELNGKGNVSGR